MIQYGSQRISLCGWKLHFMPAGHVGTDRLDWQALVENSHSPSEHLHHGALLFQMKIRCNRLIVTILLTSDNTVQCITVSYHLASNSYLIWPHPAPGVCCVVSDPAPGVCCVVSVGTIIITIITITFLPAQILEHQCFRTHPLTLPPWMLGNLAMAALLSGRRHLPAGEPRGPQKTPTVDQMSSSTSTHSCAIHQRQEEGVVVWR